MGRPLTAYPEDPKVAINASAIKVYRAALSIFEDVMDDDARAKAEAAIAEREAALDQVERNANPEWFDAAVWALYEIALAREEFTADAVWALLERRQVPPPHEPKALGAVMRFAKRAGWCVATDRTTQSKRPENHARPIRVWASRVVGKEVLT